MSRIILKKKFWHKSVAAFLMLSVLNQVFAPALALALTSGPTAPEATSFEPVDTTDMVNPLTGDFTYNMPLLEVPGPEGGYPLSLSYHSGIQPDEEASWVGLGWTLNPGAITRMVNGYPDDARNSRESMRPFWSGGKRKTVGVNVGIGLEAVSVSAGLSFSQDTYKGFGMGFSLGVGDNITHSNIGISAQPYGEGITASFGNSVNNITMSTDGFSIQKGMVNIDHNGDVSLRTQIGMIGMSTDFKSVNLGLAYSLAGCLTASLGASISTKGIKTSSSLSGISSTVQSENKGKISTYSSSSSTWIPLWLIGSPVSVGISRNYVRYWSDVTDLVYTNGVLYSPTTVNNVSDLDHTSYDTYRLTDPAHAKMTEQPDPDKQAGGTFPEYDSYSVTAQGLSGNIRPYMFQGKLYRQNTINNEDHSQDVKANLLAANRSMNSKSQFRFINDFSNSYRQSSTLFSESQYSFSTPSTGSDAIDGYDEVDNRLEGSQHVEWFTGAEVNNGVARTRGFMPCKTVSYSSDRIGGFMITNATGVTYHYALPAYSSGENVKTEKIDRSKGYFFNEYKKSSYAYTWYLTAITGPDYVDRGASGLDSQDWGYWVEFDYGNWANDYAWHNKPSLDLDNEFLTNIKGKKQVYYLDAIKTRSHTALFVKELRADAKDSQAKVTPSAVYGCDVYNQWGQRIDSERIPTFLYPRASLRLSKILLYQNDQLESSEYSKRNSKNYDHYFSFHGQTCDAVAYTDRVHNGYAVLDKYDISPETEMKCIKKIAFNYDYSLCPETPNSNDPEGKSYSNTPLFEGGLTGKLTLLSVDFQGQGGLRTVPPIEFEYDLDGGDPANQGEIQLIYTKNWSWVDEPGVVRVLSNNLHTGDIVTFVINNVRYYCTLLQNNQDNPNTTEIDHSPDLYAS